MSAEPLIVVVIPGWLHLVIATLGAGLGIRALQIARRNRHIANAAEDLIARIERGES